MQSSAATLLCKSTPVMMGWLDARCICPARLDATSFRVCLCVYVLMWLCVFFTSGSTPILLILFGIDYELSRYHELPYICVKSREERSNPTGSTTGDDKIDLSKHNHANPKIIIRTTI